MEYLLDKDEAGGGGIKRYDPLNMRPHLPARYRKQGLQYCISRAVNIVLYPWPHVHWYFSLY